MSKFCALGLLFEILYIHFLSRPFVRSIGYDTPLYNDYLHTWDTLRIPNQTTSGVVREEIVWMNYTHQLSLYDFGIL